MGEVLLAAASSESGGGFPVAVLAFPCFHPSPLWWDLRPAWLWDQLLLALCSVSACRSLCQSLLPAKERPQQDNVPIQPCLELDPAGTGSSPAPSTSSPSLCWDGCMDWAVSFLNLPQACTMVWGGQSSTSLPTLVLGAFLAHAQPWVWEFKDTVD